MAGLLDRLFATPSDQALWALGSGLLGVRRGNEGRALMGGMQAYNAAQQEQRRNSLTDAALEETRAQAAQRMAMIEDLKRKAAVEAEGMDYLSSGGARPIGSTVMRPETMQEQPKLDPLVLIRLFGPEKAQKIMESRNWGRDEVARTIEEEGPGGEKMVRRETRFGDPVGAPVRGYVPPQLVNQGDRQSFVKPQAGLSLPVGMSPSERDASARGWQGLALQRETLAQGVASDRRAAERDARDAAAAEKRTRNAIGQADIVISTVDEALGKVGKSTTGYGAALFGRLPRTDARALQNAVDTIKANIGFQQLQAMREASPTGGALGQVAVKELDFLQAAIANLDTWQDETTLAANLNKVKTHYENWRATLEPQRGGGGAEWGGAAAPRSVDFNSLPKGP